MQGLILINKPENITSFGVVHKIKKLAGEKRVGHTGTLDPMATGVLPVLVGRATVLSSYLLDADKTYLACIKLGVQTDTYDVTGQVLSTASVNISPRELDHALNSFLGVQYQVPPMFSALKKEGKKLYELARQGLEVDREPRQVQIYSIRRVSDVVSNSFYVRIKCSKGTYIRSICNDLGKLLGCGAVLESLCRESTHGFNLDACVDLTELTAQNIEDHILSEEIAVCTLRAIEVTQKQAIRFSNGGELDILRLHIDSPKDGEQFRIKYNRLLLGVGRYDAMKNAVVISCIVNQYTGE